MRVDPIFGSSLLDIVSTRRLIKSDQKIDIVLLLFLQTGRYLMVAEALKDPVLALNWFELRDNMPSSRMGPSKIPCWMQ